jgi:UTP-glucose-1-phosphate uridylyltransferase
MEVRKAAYKEDRLKRTNRLSLMLNSREMKALGIYCSRYRVKNKSEFLRATIMKAILKRFEDEHPTLWEENEHSLFNQNVSR